MARAKRVRDKNISQLRALKRGDMIILTHGLYVQGSHTVIPPGSIATVIKQLPNTANCHCSVEVWGKIKFRISYDDPFEII